jgi:hypothetical protein
VWGARTTLDIREGNIPNIIKRNRTMSSQPFMTCHNTNEVSNLRKWCLMRQFSFLHKSIKVPIRDLNKTKEQCNNEILYFKKKNARNIYYPKVEIVEEIKLVD